VHVNSIGIECAGHYAPDPHPVCCPLMLLAEGAVKLPLHCRPADLFVLSVGQSGSRL
jgi:hypothetical protein